MLPHKENRRRRHLGKRKAMGMLVVIGIAFALTASAGMLDWFGEMNITAEVKQSVVWDGDGEWHDWDDPIEWTIEDAVGGCQYCDKTKIWNRGCVGGKLDLNTQIWGPGGSEGVDVSYWHLPGDLTLRLENKNHDNDWSVIDDEYYINLTYNPCCPAFVWKLEGKVLLPSTEYVLIYYADQPDRFIDWGWAPLKLATVTSDADGYILDSSSTDLGDTSFPFEDDWNIGHNADYHAKDGYCHAKGAKIWLIPSLDYDDVDQMTAWNPENYMFETDLVVYFDCDILPVPWIVKAYFNNVYDVYHGFPYYIAAGEQICLIYCYGFDWAIQGGTYNIQALLVPYTL